MTAAPRLEVVSNELPAPPYPPEIRARGWRFELDMERVEQSKTWMRAPAELRPWLLMLWVKAWQRWPVGALDTDDIDNAALIGMPLTMFQTHREVLMRGWVRHSDGRLYHHVITERVIEMVGQRTKDKVRVAKWRSKQKQDVEEKVTRYSNVRTRKSQGCSTPEPEPVLKEQKHMSGSQANADATLLLKFLNDKAGRHYRPTLKTLEPILARLNEGFSVSDCKAVVMRRCRKWKGDEKMHEYLRPATLFGAKNFAQYVGEVPPDGDMAGGDDADEIVS